VQEVRDDAQYAEAAGEYHEFVVLSQFSEDVLLEFLASLLALRRMRRVATALQEAATASRGLVHRWALESLCCVMDDVQVAAGPKRRDGLRACLTRSRFLPSPPSHLVLELGQYAIRQPPLSELLSHFTSCPMHFPGLARYSFLS
jgi:hypothetical protein